MSRTRLVTAAAAALALVAAAPAAAAPANDNIKDAIAVSGVSKPAAVTYDVSSATPETGEKVYASGDTIWFSWKPNVAGATFADVCGAPGGHLVHVFKLKANTQLSVTNLESPSIGAPDSADLPKGSFCKVHWRAQAGVTYYLQVDRYVNANWQYDLVIDQDTQPPTWPNLITQPSITGPNVQETFSHPEASNTFVCALDSLNFDRCTSPHALENVKDGFHTFRVRTMDPHGNLSPIRSQYWKVDATAPKTTITSAAGATPITFSTNEPASTVCSLDGAAFAPCSSPYQAPELAPGEHKLQVKAADPYGNAQQVPVEAKWTVAAPVQTATEEPSGGTVSTSGSTTGTGTTTGTTPPACTLKLTAPKKASRAALRRGLRVKVAASGTGCATKVALEQGRRTLATAKLGATVVLKTRRARRGTLTIVAGGVKRTLKVT